MIQIKEATAYSSVDYEYCINQIIHEQTKCGWKFIDIKHSVAAYAISANSNVKLFSALLLFDDSPTADFPTSLNQ